MSAVKRLENWESEELFSRFLFFVKFFCYICTMSNVNFNNKILCFVICIKRYKVNSVLLKSAKYKMAQRFNIHPTTFIKYLDFCIENNIIRFDEKKNQYTVIKFNTIIKEYFESTGNYFSKHEILKSKDINFKNILIEVEKHIVYDNVIARQEHKIKTNGRKVRAIKFLSQTGKNSLRGYSNRYLKSILKKGLNCVENKETLKNYSETIRTSARNTAKQTGFSVSKSNKLLNNLNQYTRKIDSFWVNGVSFFKIEELRVKYPQATIIPFIKHDKIKVCQGSILNKMS